MIGARTLRAAALASLLVGCGDDPPGTADASVLPDAGAPGFDASFREAGPLPDARTTTPDTDGNTTWAEGPVIAAGSAPITGEISTDGDSDYLRIMATAGQYLAVRLRQPPSMDFGASPGLSVVTPDMRYLVGINDYRGCAGDPDIPESVFRVATTGTYYVELSAGRVPPSLSGPQAWIVEVIDLATSASTLLVEEGRPATITRGHRCVLGAFETADDVDELTTDLDAYPYLQAADPARHGSTGTAAWLEVRLGATTLARSSTAGATVDALGVVVERAGATVRLGAPSTQGLNDHYLLRPATVGLYGPGIERAEAAEAANDTPAGAELVALSATDVGGYPPLLALSLPPGDVDHYAVDLETSLEVECTSGRWLGTSPRDLEITVFDPGGATVVSARETRMTNARIVLELGRRGLLAGRYVVKVRATRHEPGIDGHLAACSFRRDGA